MNIKFKSVMLSLFLMCSLISPMVNTISKADNNITCDRRSKKVENNKEYAPKLVKLVQLSSKVIEITFDESVDSTNALCLRNYWVQSLDKEIPVGIATVGKNDKFDENNSLKRKDGNIISKDEKNKVFEIHFNNEISPGENYKLMASYIKAAGGKPYSGINGEIKFTGK